MYSFPKDVRTPHTSHAVESLTFVLSSIAVAVADDDADDVDVADDVAVAVAVAAEFLAIALFLLLISRPINVLTNSSSQSTVTALDSIIKVI